MILYKEAIDLGCSPLKQCRKSNQWHGAILGNSKAQLEIMGLVVVVILVSLGFLFALQFVVLEAPENARETFTREQIAQNTLHTLVLTTTTCQGLDMTELIQDCFDSLSDLDCSGKTSCEFISVTTSTILNDTLKSWNKNYDFTLTRGERALIQLKNRGCPNDRDVGRMFLPSRDGGDKILVRLDVCD
jgi:hypothetical protein